MNGICFFPYTQDDKLGVELLARYTVLHCFVFLNKDKWKVCCSFIDFYFVIKIGGNGKPRTKTAGDGFHTGKARASF